MITFKLEPEPAPPAFVAAMISASLIVAKVYPDPAVVTEAAVITPPVCVTSQMPPVPSPRIGIAVIVEPEDVEKLPVQLDINNVQLKNVAIILRKDIQSPIKEASHKFSAKSPQKHKRSPRIKLKKKLIHT